MPLDATAPGLDALLLATVLRLELSDRDLRVDDKRYLRAYVSNAPII